MNRHDTKEVIYDRIKKIREIIPDAILRTTCIVGFPGETDELFKETIQNIKEINFAQLHIFPYSPRKNTIAANMKNQIDRRRARITDNRGRNDNRSIQAKICRINQFIAMINKINNLKAEIEGLKASNAAEVEALRIKYLSKKGEVSLLFNDFRNVPKEQKREIGQALNALRQTYETRINELRETLEANGANKAAEELDLTRTPDPIALGTRHPLSLVREQIIDIFSRVGFTVAEGPEVEDDKHVFGMLNFAPEHPARDMQDTFWLTEDLLLRTHTSPGQIRVMDNQAPPIKVLVPGKVFRSDSDATHSPMFSQMEGLVVDKGITLCDLQGMLDEFVQQVYGEGTRTRLRPSFFPFTEPSAEMDVSCTLCKGKGCSLCKGAGWLEILGCGMVDPAVLEANGIDSSVYTGYAFGMGIERITNLKYQVKDLRMFSENDVRFLDEFTSAK